MEFGSYKCIAGPSRGAFGSVYKAMRVDQPGVFFAVKTVQDPNNEAQRQSLRREVKVLSRVQHPQVVRLIEHHLDLPVPYVVLEYLPGGNLRPYVGRMSLAGACTLLHSIAGALGAFHGAGGFHRDVKPDNILVAPDGTPVLADAGLANVPVPGSALTQRVGGTPGYIDPWVVNGLYDPAADLYALAVTVAELLTGVAPQSLYNPKGFALAPEHLPIPATEHRVAMHQLLTAMMTPERAHRPSAALVQQYAQVLLTGGRLPLLRRPPRRSVTGDAGGDLAGTLAAGALLLLLGVGVAALIAED